MEKIQHRHKSGKSPGHVEKISGFVEISGNGRKIALTGFFCALRWRAIRESLHKNAFCWRACASPFDSPAPSAKGAPVRAGEGLAMMRVRARPSGKGRDPEASAGTRRTSRKKFSKGAGACRSWQVWRGKRKGLQGRTPLWEYRKKNSRMREAEKKSPKAQANR